MRKLLRRDSRLAFPAFSAPLREGFSGQSVPIRAIRGSISFAFGNVPRQILGDFALKSHFSQTVNRF